MNKVTVRLSAEYEAALSEVNKNGIDNSEFIRAAILHYYSSGTWREPAKLDEAVESIPIQEKVIATDKLSDRPSDRCITEALDAGFPQTEKVQRAENGLSLFKSRACISRICFKR